MKVIVVEKADILIPNPNHKNITASGQTIKAETILEGQPKNIRGLRKGRPFVYKTFVTKKGQMIFLNKVKPIKEMERTEVTLGADSQVSSTKVDVTSINSDSNNKYIGIIVGALSGYGYCKYKKYSTKKMTKFIIAGAVLGLGAGYYFDGKSKLTIEKSK